VKVYVVQNNGGTLSAHQIWRNHIEMLLDLESEKKLWVAYAQLHMLSHLHDQGTQEGYAQVAFFDVDGLVRVYDIKKDFCLNPLFILDAPVYTSREIRDAKFLK